MLDLQTRTLDFEHDRALSPERNDGALAPADDDSVQVDNAVLTGHATEFGAERRSAEHDCDVHVIWQQRAGEALRGGPLVQLLGVHHRAIHIDRRGARGFVHVLAPFSASHMHLRQGRLGFLYPLALAILLVAGALERGPSRRESNLLGLAVCELTVDDVAENGLSGLSRD